MSFDKVSQYTTHSLSQQRERSKKTFLASIIRIVFVRQGKFPINIKLFHFLKHIKEDWYMQRLRQNPIHLKTQVNCLSHSIVLFYT